MAFSDIPIRANSDDVEASWWNILRTKLSTGEQTLVINDDNTIEFITELGSTPSTPSTGQNKVYFKDDGKMYKLDDAGIETQIGSGSGGGSKNYLSSENSTIDDSIADWETDDGAGSTASYLTLALTSTSGELLAGDNSLKISKSANNANGEFIKVLSETIDPADRGRQLFGSFEFNPISGYVSSDLKLEIYDVTNSAVLYSGIADDLELLNASETFNYSTYTESTTEQIEFRLVVNNTNTNAFTASIDDIKLGPNNYVVGEISHGLKSFTPSFSNFTIGNGTVDVAAYSRQGQWMKGRVEVTLGSTSSMSTDPYIATPNSYTIDSDFLGFNYECKVGSGEILDSGTGRHPINVNAYSSTILVLRRWGSSNAQDTITSTAPMTWATNDRFVFDFEVPITEWKHGNNFSAIEASYQTVKAKASLTASGNITSTATVQGFDTVDYDTHNCISGSGTTSWKFTAPRKGIYKIYSQSALAVTTSTFNEYRLDINVNGSLVRLAKTIKETTGSTTPPTISVQDSIELEKGDYLSISASTSSTLARNTAGWANFVTIEAIPDFNVIGVYKEEELLESSGALGNYTITAGQWGDLTSLDLTSGEWDIKAQAIYYSNGAVTTGNINLGISTTTGNSATGLTHGDTLMFATKNQTTQTANPLNIYVDGITVTDTTTYYLKAQAATSITNLQFAYKISARRIK